MSEKKTGRPTKLTPELLEEVVKYVRTGAYVETAAAAAGVSKVSLYDWLKRGKRGDKSNNGLYIEFSEAMSQAVAESELRDIALIGKAASRNWTAAAWRLERKHPQRWGRREVQDVHVSGGMALRQMSKTEEAEYQNRVAEFFGIPETFEAEEEDVNIDSVDIEAEVNE